MKLKQLEQELQSVRFTKTPKIELEQYPTSAHLAATILYTAETQYGDIEGKTVADLGCGGCILGIGSIMLGAEHVIGVDIDRDSLDIAQENLEETEAEVDLVHCNVLDIGNRCGLTGIPLVDTVIMNPPFGTRHKGIDVLFLEAALKIASTTVYSLHKSSTRDFLLKKAESWGAKASVIAQLRYDIPALYNHHKKKSVDIEVDVLRLDVSMIPRGKVQLSSTTD